MTDITWFGQHLFTLYSQVGHLAVLTASLAAAGGAWAARRLGMARASPQTHTTVNRTALAAGTVAAALAAVGLRIQAVSYGAGTPDLLNGVTWLAITLACGSVAQSAPAVVAAWLHPGPPLLSPQRGGASPDAQQLMAGLSGLRAGVDRIRAAHDEALARMETTADASSKDAYRQAALAMEPRLQLALQLQEAAGVAVVRAQAQCVVDVLLAHRPTVVLEQLQASASSRALGDAVEGVQAFVGSAQQACQLLGAQAKGGADSWAVQAAVPGAAQQVAAYHDAATELRLGYERILHRLHALRLQQQAHTDAEQVAQAANGLALTNADPQQPTNALAELGNADLAASRALELLPAENTTLPDALARASHALASEDAEPLRQLLAGFRQLEG